MKKWGILGWGKSGQAVAHYLSSQKQKFIAIDDFAKECVQTIDFSEIHTLVISPGIKMEHSFIQEAKKRKIPITTEVELGLNLCKKRGISLVAITGSVGKTTTSLLLTHLLERGGKKAFCLGNVGTPILSFFLEETPCDLLVLELSSFQIEKMEAKELFDQVVILNLYPNHLDHHKSYEEYKSVKLSLADFLKPKGELMLTEETFAAYGKKDERVCLFEKERIAYDLAKNYRGSLFLPNLQVAAVIANRYGVTVTQEILDSFKPPAHRLESVCEIKGISFVNDSKATSVKATMTAIESTKKRVILIAGGVDKGADFTPWLELFKNKVKLMVVIGEAKDKLAALFQDHVPVVKTSDIQEAVKIAFKNAEKEECIMLSPGCASYDQFKNFEERGDCFKQIVLKLQGEI